MSAADGGLSAGQRVRVRPVAADGVCRRALILAADGDGKYEVEFEPDNEEDVVEAARLEPLLPFEEAGMEGSSVGMGAVEAAERFKAQGNALFKLRDPAAAIEQYVAGIRGLTADASLSAGARCLVKGAGPAAHGALRSALVLAVDSDSADIEYEPDAPSVRASGKSEQMAERLAALLLQAEALQPDDAAPGRDGGDGAPRRAPTSAARPPAPAETSWSSWLLGGSRRDAAAEEADSASESGAEAEAEDAVPKRRIVLVVHGSQPALLCALLLNSSKCSLLLGDWAAALARASRAERIAAHDAREREKTAALRRTALVVCARASLGMQKFGWATTFASRLLAAPLPGCGADAAAAASKEARALLRDIQRRAAEVKRSNKRLAKELSAWVQAAMEASGEAGAALPLVAERPTVREPA